VSEKTSKLKSYEGGDRWDTSSDILADLKNFEKMMREEMKYERVRVAENYPSIEIWPPSLWSWVMRKRD
jgi:hypothetical protein